MLLAELALLLTAAAGSSAPTPAELDALDERWAQAIVKRDAAALEQLLADDLIYGHASGVLDTKQSYIAKIRSGKQIYATLERRKCSARVLDSGNGVTHCWAHVTGTNAEGKFDDKLMMLHVWTRNATDGKWRLIGHQTARVPNLP